MRGYLTMMPPLSGTPPTTAESNLLSASSNDLGPGNLIIKPNIEIKSNQTSNFPRALVLSLIPNPQRLPDNFFIFFISSCLPPFALVFSVCSVHRYLLHQSRYLITTNDDRGNERDRDSISHQTNNPRPQSWPTKLPRSTMLLCWAPV